MRKWPCNQWSSSLWWVICYKWNWIPRVVQERSLDSTWGCNGCSVAKSSPTLWDHMDCSMPSFPVLHCLTEFAQIHVHWVSDAIQSSHHLLPPSPLALNLSQHQSLFQWVSSLSSGQSNRTSTSVLPIKTQGWFPFSSLQLLSCVHFLQPHGLQHARLPCPSPTPGACANSCPSSQWCHPTISSSVVPFSSCLQSFPASGSYSMSQFFSSGGQSIGVSAIASVLPMNIQDQFPLGLIHLISLQSKSLEHQNSRASILQCSAFFIIQLSYSYMTTGKTVALTTCIFVGKVISLLFRICCGVVEETSKKKKKKRMQEYPFLPVLIFFELCLKNMKR